jgi:hypothetical protein
LSAKKGRGSTNLLISDPRRKIKRRKLNDGTAQMEQRENEQINSIIHLDPPQADSGVTFDAAGQQPAPFRPVNPFKPPLVPMYQQVEKPYPGTKKRPRQEFESGMANGSNLSGIDMRLYETAKDRDNSENNSQSNASKHDEDVEFKDPE